MNKCDLPDGWGGAERLDAACRQQIPISAATGEGLDALSRAIAEALGLADWSDATTAAWTPRQAAGMAKALEKLSDRPARVIEALQEVLEIPPEGLIWPENGPTV
jgi:50S ribosomal subunit-associated GTPase HflX